MCQVEEIFQLHPWICDKCDPDKFTNVYMDIIFLKTKFCQITLCGHTFLAVLFSGKRFGIRIVISISNVPANNCLE